MSDLKSNDDGDEKKKPENQSTMSNQITESEVLIESKFLTEKRYAYNWGFIFLISSLVDIILLGTILILNLPDWLFIPIAAIEILKRMYSTLFGWDCTQYNIGNSGIWFLWGLFTPAISLLFASSKLMLRKKYK